MIFLRIVLLISVILGNGHGQWVKDLKMKLNEYIMRSQTLAEELSKLKNTKQELDSLKLEFRDLSKIFRMMNVAETCIELGRRGLNDSKYYDLDPDGVNRGQVPIKAYCELPSGVTSIGRTEEIEIGHCNTSKCFVYVI